MIEAMQTVIGLDEFGNLKPLVSEQFYFALLEVAQMAYAENMI